MTTFFSWQHAVRGSKLEPTTKLVCYTIWSHMASDGTGCFPSYALIALESGLSRSTVILHVGKAIDAGFLETEERQRKDGGDTSNLYRPCFPIGGPADAPGESGKRTGGSPAAAPLLTEQPNNPTDSTPKAPKGAELVDGAFEDFWKAYPVKVGKPVALRAFLKAKPPAGELMVGLERWIASEEWEKEKGRYIPHPPTFLNQRRWEDMPRSMAVPKTDLERRNDEFLKSFTGQAANNEKQIA